MSISAPKGVRSRLNQTTRFDPDEAVEICDPPWPNRAFVEGWLAEKRAKADRRERITRWAAVIAAFGTVASIVLPLLFTESLRSPIVTVRQAALPQIITLTCSGERETDAPRYSSDLRQLSSPEPPVKNDVIVINLAKGTVSWGTVSSGLSGLTVETAHITQIDDVHVEFDGKDSLDWGTREVHGDINRVTGKTTITDSLKKDQPSRDWQTDSYSLTCKVTDRLF